MLRASLFSARNGNFIHASELLFIISTIILFPNQRYVARLVIERPKCNCKDRRAPLVLVHARMRPKIFIPVTLCFCPLVDIFNILSPSPKCVFVKLRLKQLQKILKCCMIQTCQRNQGLIVLGMIKLTPRYKEYAADKAGNP